MCVNSPLYRRRLLLRRQPLYFRERDLSRRRFISLLHSGGKEELTDAFLTIQGWLIPCKIEPLTLQDKLLTTNHPVCCEIPGYTFGSGATSNRSHARPCWTRKLLSLPLSVPPFFWLGIQSVMPSANLLQLSPELRLELLRSFTR